MLFNDVHGTLWIRRIFEERGGSGVFSCLQGRSMERPYKHENSRVGGDFPRHKNKKIVIICEFLNGQKKSSCASGGMKF